MNQAEVSEAPQITLGKKPWPIPELAVRQIMRIVPAMMRAQKIKFDDITEADILLLYDIGYVALTRAHPELKREEFDDLPITVDELLAALPVISRQAGMKLAEAGEANAGEANQAAPAM